MTSKETIKRDHVDRLNYYKKLFETQELNVKILEKKLSNTKQKLHEICGQMKTELKFEKNNRIIILNFD